MPQGKEVYNYHQNIMKGSTNPHNVRRNRKNPKQEKPRQQMTSHTIKIHFRAHEFVRLMYFNG